MIEAFTLLADRNTRNRECRFDQTADMILFVNSLGVPREQLCHAEKPVKEKGYTRITLTCRQPLGNTFFLQYRIYADHGLHKYRCSRIGVITTLYLMDTANSAQYYLPPNAALALSNKNRIKRLDEAKGRLMAFYQKQWQKANRVAREHIRDKMESVSSRYQSRLSVLERVLVHRITDM